MPTYTILMTQIKIKMILHNNNYINWLEKIIKIN